MNWKNKLRCTVSVLAISALAACGGGGGGDSDAGGGGGGGEVAKAEGFFEGKTADGRSLTGVVLDNGEYWMMYTKNSGEIGGVIQGRSTQTASAFTSVDGRDFNFESGAVSDVSIDGDYLSKKSLDGRLSHDRLGQTFSFATSYDDSYERPATLADIAGSYTAAAITLEGGEAAAFTVEGSGSISGSTPSGCLFTGSATPRGSVAVYDLTLSFLGARCMQGSSTIKGVAILDLDSKLLIGAALDETRAKMNFFAAQKAGTANAATPG